ncbi:GDP-L-fucose synthase family protein [Parvularcula dongshanensis]|uniref:GDP-L-fucose synthase n=1 Tax=Parvularcula dongshanensis TaxID=1173995 RepID=A0A840I453_9PROT|nr:GDP-L-fucose synthase [Parvularcula dongshanensis]MBB4658948.1 GDP-L-fucose synthase [Parvularcula dongshanensis]
MTIFDLAGKKVYVAGHRGMVGKALVRRLGAESCEVLTARRDELDLTDQRQTLDWFASARPDAVFVAAALVGGIYANSTYPAKFLFQNLMIATNAIEAARLVGVSKLVFLGSTCIYPKHASQPITEDALLTGPLEPTNESYAIAKIAGVKLCQAYQRQYGCRFISAMPTNLYGPGDNYHPENSHVIAGMFNRVREARRESKPFTVWGTGRPRREFMHVDDCADALVHLMANYEDDAPINVGTGKDITIAELAEIIAAVAGFDGPITYDQSKPDGTPRKLTDVTRLFRTGWRPKVELRDGLVTTWNDYLAEVGESLSGGRRTFASR